MRTFWKFFAAALVMVVLIAGGWLIYGRIADAMQEPQPTARGGAGVAVEVAPVQVGLIRDVRMLTGSLQAPAQFDLAPRISGRLERLTVDIGDMVQRGQLIAQLDDQEYQQQLEQARAEQRVAQATLEEKRSAVEIAEREFGRIVRLYEEEIASESELDVARSRLQAEQAAVQVAEAQVAQRQAAVRAAEVRLAYTQIRATWQEGGDQRIVGERFVNEGATVAANAPLISLLDLSTLRAVVHVTEGEYGRLAIGQQASIIPPIEGGNHTGRVARIAPVFREGSRQARVEIEVPNPQGLLKPGMFVRVSLELDRDEQATIVPRQALLRRDGQQGIFVADESGKARFVPLTLGIIERDRIQVLDPPLNGYVVTLGQHLLGDDMTIVIADTAEPEKTGSGGVLSSGDLEGTEGGP